MDATDEDIIFDKNSACMRCNEYKNRIEPESKHGRGHEKELQSLIQSIKDAGKGKEYDCILVFSGGLDSSYMLHLDMKEWGLHPFVFHIDVGWNLPVAEDNIKRITDKLGVKLYVKKMDLNEMREMQLAWFRTGLEMLDAPQDQAFISLIEKYSQKLGVKYILNVYNVCTEVVADPASWEKGAGPTGDGTYIRDVVKKCCKIPIKNYTYTSGLKHKFVIPYLKGAKTVKPLNIVEFTKIPMVKTLADEYGYVPYGQKHFEDLITKFLEGWWQPTRFGHDIRRAQLSSLVVTGQKTCDEALKILEQPPLSEEESKKLFKDVAKRLEICEEDLFKFHDMPECSEKFRSQEKFYNLGIKLYEMIGLEKRIRK